MERRRRLEVEAGGGLYLKQTGHPGVPDRLVLMPIPEEHRALVSRYVWFEELKAPKGVVSKIQERVIGWLRRRGYRAEIVKAVSGRGAAPDREG